MAAQGRISSSPFLLLSLAMIAMPLADAAVPAAIFIFGDSTADVGTNNYLPESLAKADSLYNGIDYPNSKPTGRFSNGFNSADQIVRLMGYKISPPPFLRLLNRTSTFKRNILRGVNFASGGSGLLDETGKVLYRKVIALGEQIQQFATVHGNITELLGPDATARLLSKSMFLISAGSNDIFEYQSSNRTLSKQEFMTTLLSTYHHHLENLFNLGARRFGIISVPPMGCCPYLRLFNGTGGCIEELNEFARTFYTEIEAILEKSSSELRGMKYSLGNAYDMTMNIIDNPFAFSFKDVTTACCGGGTFNAESPCEPTSKLCLNRHDYLFWDMFHPTQAASELAALTLYGGAQRFVTPMNFSQLAVVDV